MRIYAFADGSIPRHRRPDCGDAPQWAERPGNPRGRRRERLRHFPGKGQRGAPQAGRRGSVYLVHRLAHRQIDIETGDFAAHLEQLRHTLEVAQVLGAKRLRMFSFYIPVGKDPADYRNRVIDQVGEMLRVGEGSGVLFCHENEKGIYGDIASRCLDQVLQWC